MQLIDVHCHLESRYFAENLDSVIADARRAGIVTLITSTTGPSEWEHSRSIAQNFKEVEFALGLHPWYISLHDTGKLDELYTAGEKGAVAIGEIGLDKKIDSPDFETQLLFFKRQLKIATETGLPVITHCRGAFNELIEIVKENDMSGCGGIVHNFTGSAEIAEQLMEHNFMFSLGGILTYKLSRKRTKMMHTIYPDHFLLETDSPDIVPLPRKDKPNVPANIVLNLEAAARILETAPEEVAAVTTANAKRMFRL